MAKRSPILGYNHNVRYRGLVFHVQTEDSGVLSPHLFTHLFHHGVIVSTRKYVYDAGSTEEAIKALMQAQHKAVMKDLKRGNFDDKIDQYLGGTPGLLPRGEAAAASATTSTLTDEEVTDPERARPPHLARPSQTGLPRFDSSGEHALPEDSLSGATILDGGLALGREPTLEEPALGLRPTEQAVPGAGPAASRTTTAERTSRPSQVRSSLSAEDAEATEAVRTESPGDSQAEILIQLEVDDSDDVAHPRRRRVPRDTDVAGPEDMRPSLDLSAFSDGVPPALAGPPTLRTSELTGQLPGSGSASGPTERRASTAVGAASLPPARPISRPATRPAMVAPQVVSRPLPAEDRRTAGTDAIEVYAAAPPSAELPQQPPERPGQYSQHKKISTRIPQEADRSGARPLHPQQQATIPQIQRQGSTPHIPAPARPGSAQQTAPRMSPPGPAIARTGTPPPQPAMRQTGVPMPAQSAPRTGPTAIPPAPGAPRTGPTAIPPAPPGAPRTGPTAIPQAVGRPTPTPIPIPTMRPGDKPPAVPPPLPRSPVTGTTPVQAPGAAPVAAVASAPTAPAASRTGSPSNNSGVVMTRPAVIVGAPGKPASTSQRVRKAREDEGRGFGQGLISEKSLDEVILAYLSEDAEEK